MKVWTGDCYRLVPCTVEAAALREAGYELVEDDVEAPPAPSELPKPKSKAPKAK